jgi:hypothetical protein
MRLVCQITLCLTATLALPGCDMWKLGKPKAPGSYAACLSERLASIHTVEGSAAVIGACRVEAPPGSDLRKSQSLLNGVQVTGRGGLDETYGVSRAFSGTLWNASPDHVVTEVKIRISAKPKLESKAASAPEGQSTWVYSVPLELWPQTAAPFTITIIPVPPSELEWGVISVHGLTLAEARAVR